ncbi:MAG: hypothetical protein HZC55_14505 [Verrucomicrobia bacterium]|nr:hypothetical protein [Verrucomicrobiota bacterium]
MRKGTFHVVLLALALAPSPAPGEEPWSNLKLGMTPEEAYLTLGFPLLRTAGKGFETWTYDDGAEVLLHGSLIGWTTPRSLPAPARHVDVWRNRPKADYFPTFLAAIPPPPPPLPATRIDPATLEVPSSQRTFLPFYVYRRR